MSYYIAATLRAPFEEAIKQTEAALKDEGFGVLTRIDVRETLKAKIGADFRPYTILGACNPALAHEALQLEDKVGTMLPCNVVVRALDEETSLLEAFDPDAMMGLADNDALHAVATDAKERLTAALDALASAEGTR